MNLCFALGSRQDERVAELGQRLAASESPGLVTAVAVTLLVAFGIKAAAFPLFFWLPASYHTPPAAISARS